jgi:hypothetical protein
VSAAELLVCAARLLLETALTDENLGALSRSDDALRGS